MINRLAVTTLWVTDQNEALSFYTEKLGFEIRSDVTFGEYRWVSVGPKNQPDFEIGLTPLKPEGGLTDEDVNALKKLLVEGKLSGAVWKTDDCRKTYAVLVSKGVEFVEPPEDRPYGNVEAIFKDSSGNMMVLSQDGV
jgi:catechol 2,3-dioxygenase-like lactoylglutathione lyase family enzyme